MRNPTYDEVKALPHGTKVRVKISTHPLTDGAISISKDGRRVYICTNVVNGNRAEDKLGYNYSWEVDRSNISRVSFETEPVELYPIF